MTSKIDAAIHLHNMTKAAQTLLGICAGIVADGQINDMEIHFLRTWLKENEELINEWPGNVIAGRVEAALADGVITSDERSDLLETLQEMSGNYFATTGAAAPDSPFAQLDDDPSIFFESMSYCFTGKFVFGTRAACERAVLKRGAMPLDKVSKKLDYLVIGAIVSPDWANTTYGRKIETAVKYRDEFGMPCIISEQQWTDALAFSV